MQKFCFIIGSFSLRAMHLGTFGAEIFLRYSRIFVKGDFVIGGVECMCHVADGSDFIVCTCKDIHQTCDCQVHSICAIGVHTDFWQTIWQSFRNQ